MGRRGLAGADKHMRISRPVGRVTFDSVGGQCIKGAEGRRRSAGLEQDGRAGDPRAQCRCGETVIDRQQHRPVRRPGEAPLGMDRLDRGLGLEPTRLAEPDRAPKLGLGRLDQRVVPQRGVLLSKRDVACSSGRAAGLAMQDQGEQAGRLGMVGDKLADEPGQPLRFAGQRPVAGTAQVHPAV